MAHEIGDDYTHTYHLDELYKVCNNIAKSVVTSLAPINKNTRNARKTEKEKNSCTQAVSKLTGRKPTEIGGLTVVHV